MTCDHHLLLMTSPPLFRKTGFVLAKEQIVKAFANLGDQAAKAINALKNQAIDRSYS